MKPAIINLWFNNNFGPPTSVIPNPTCEIRVDWSNDRHHAVKIEYPQSKKEVLVSLKRLIHIIKNDCNL